jgi:uncharacterized protein
VPCSHDVEAVTFGTEDGVRLEGELRLPDGPARGSGVICHPHPRHGGSKDHPILWAIRNELAGTHDVATLSFNFRGVMGSGGTYGGGRDELRDARAAIGRVREAVPDLPTVLCGWSFGASVALREALDDDRVAALVLYGLPLSPHDVSLPPLPDAATLRTFRLPVLLLTGDADIYCPAPALTALGGQLPHGEVVVLEGTDHFLWRHEREAAAIAGAFVDRVLTPSP